MEQKIIRISASLHSEYKKLVSKFPTLTLSSATEILINYALKRGEIEESKETAYKTVKELDQTFRKWMRQQEKIHLSKISEELLALAHELRDTTTKQDLKLQSDKIAKSFKDSYEYITNILVDDNTKTKLEHKRNGEFSVNSMHIHILVSARDKSQTITLNPNINNRNRFNRVHFYLNSERAFDKMFDYKREESSNE